MPLAAGPVVEAAAVAAAVQVVAQMALRVQLAQTVALEVVGQDLLKPVDGIIHILMLLAVTTTEAPEALEAVEETAVQLKQHQH